MNKFSGHFLLLLSFLIASACIGDKEEPGFFSTRKLSKIVFEESLNNDAEDVVRTDTYLFDNNQLTHTTVQTFSQDNLTHETTLYYAEGTVTLTDENDNIAIYTLGDMGYATECTYQLDHQTRKYHFTYSGKYLTRIDEEIDGISYSSVELAYDNESLSHLIANGQRTNYQIGNELNLHQLPCLQVHDIYPLSLHTDAIYAGVLGAQSKYLIIKNTPEGNEKEYTEYTYKQDTNGILTGIKVMTTYMDTVIDGMGNALTEKKTHTRNIKITLE